jgi:hypothetical protein
MQVTHLSTGPVLEVAGHTLQHACPRYGRRHHKESTAITPPKIKLLGEKFSPDYVLWFITYNDMRLASGEIYAFNHYLKNAPNSAFYEAYYKTRIGLNKLLMSCYTYNLLRYVYATQPQKIFNNDEEKISLDEADDLLRQLNIEA